MKQRGVVNSCTLAEVPLVYLILPGKCGHAVPLHCLVGTSIKAMWIFEYLLLRIFLSIPFHCLCVTEWKHIHQKYHVLLVLFHKKGS